jgi:hypothetical protein
MDFIMRYGSPPRPTTTELEFCFDNMKKLITFVTSMNLKGQITYHFTHIMSSAGHGLRRCN